MGNPGGLFEQVCLDLLVEESIFPAENPTSGEYHDP